MTRILRPHANCATARLASGGPGRRSSHGTDRDGLRAPRRFHAHRRRRAARVDGRQGRRASPLRRRGGQDEPRPRPRGWGGGGAAAVAGLAFWGKAEGKMNLALDDVGGAVLVVSQFTLYGDSAKGRRP